MDIVSTVTTLLLYYGTDCYFLLSSKSEHWNRIEIDDSFIHVVQYREKRKVGCERDRTIPLVNTSMPIILKFFEL